MIPAWLAPRTALRFAPWALIAALAVALLLTRHMLAARTADRDRWQAARAMLAAEIEAQTERALAADRAHAAQIAARDARIAEETQHDLEARLADARAAAADHARRLSDRTGGAGGGGRADLPAAPTASGEPAAADRATELAADLTLCAENTVIAAGWQDWWGRVTAERATSGE